MSISEEGLSLVLVLLHRRELLRNCLAVPFLLRPLRAQTLPEMRGLAKQSRRVEERQSRVFAKALLASSAALIK
jgi:hypothetical protein